MIIPVYNAERYIKESLYSVVNQTYTNLEIIVLDDCSNDKSIDIVNEFSDSRIKVIRNEVNLKQPRTRNKGLKVALGKYIANMDADDISSLDRIEKQVSYMENNPDVDICGTFAKMFGDVKLSRVTKRPVDDEDIRLYSVTSCPMIHPTVMFRASSVKKFNIHYDLQYKYAQDYELWSRLALQGVKFHNIPEVLFYYRISKDQIGSKHGVEQKRLANAITKRNIQAVLGNDFSLICLEKDIVSMDDIRTDYSKISFRLEKSNTINNKAKFFEITILNLAESRTYLGIKLFVELMKWNKRSIISNNTLRLFFKCIIHWGN